MSATMSNPAATNPQTPVSVLADNLMRRVLRISDPRNAQEVADGLGRAYPTESAELNEEIQGLPIGLPAPPVVTALSTSMASRELDQARAYIDRDLAFLSGSSQLKEIEVELLSWGDTIRTWLADGAMATSQALDSAARDRVFSARRILLDYARLARLLGALTPGFNIPYRRFARSLDEAAGILLVSLGEALAQIGFSGDRLLLQAPVADLSARADAAVAALRNLSGSVQDAFSPTAWPWGLNAYRELLQELESAGHGDIRVLLVESGLRAFTDELIQRISNSSGDGYRALAATQVVALERVERLIRVALKYGKNSPPLASFLSALQLFVDTFNGGNAGRLIALGRPLLSATGLYSFGGLDAATSTLLSLVQQRSIVAQSADSLFGTDLNQTDAAYQFVIDTALYSLDLAIDLYSVGINPNGTGRIEHRAAAYGLYIANLLQLVPSTAGSAARGQLRRQLLSTGGVSLVQNALSVSVNLLGAGIYNFTYTQLTAAQLQQTAPAPTAPPSVPAATPQATIHLLTQELATLDSRHASLVTLASALTPGNLVPVGVMSPVRTALKTAYDALPGEAGASLPGLGMGHLVPAPVEVTTTQIAASVAKIAQ